MKNKKIGIGSLSLLLVIIAFVWAFNIFGVCVGDHILATLNIPTWSNMANATGTHYTIFYSFIFSTLSYIYPAPTPAISDAPFVASAPEAATIPITISPVPPVARPIIK